MTRPVLPYGEAWNLILKTDKHLATLIKNTDFQKIGFETANKVIQIIKSNDQLVKKIGPNKIKDFCARVIFKYSKSNPVIKKIFSDVLSGIIRGRL